MTATLLELGDATSRNLEFSHRDDVSVSYGEETITETNLLEIRRRHPERVDVHAFSKPVEGRNGADWEWHIVGEKLTAKMRVQAKRLQSTNVLKIKHKVASSGKQQRDLLIAEAHTDKMKPVYCIYCTEPQRRFWKQPTPPLGYKSYHMGCLLADASDVPEATKGLVAIEKICIPWHYLFERSIFVHKIRESVEADYDDTIQSVGVRYTLAPIPPEDGAREPAGRSGWNAPTVADLNEDTGREFDRIGVTETTAEDLERLLAETDEGWRIAQHDREQLHDRGICRMIVMDVRNERGSL